MLSTFTLSYYFSCLIESHLINNPSKYSIDVGRKCGVGTATQPTVLAQGVEVMATEISPFVAVVFRANGLHFFV